MQKLIISEEKISGENPVTVLTLKGTLETTNATSLEEVIGRILASDRYRIVVDLSDVSYISSAGWGIFICEIKRVRRKCGDIKLAAMRAGVREVFDLLEFNNILRVYPGTGEAIRDFEVPIGAKSD
ncbi:MAG: STAS domain-containing protein [Candidatus Krumholzibacteriia bacterium]